MISHPPCSYTGTVIFFPLRSEIFVPPPLEPGWTQYGSNTHLNRKVKDYMHKSVYALSLEKRSFLESQCGFFLYQSMIAQGCRTTSLPHPISGFSILCSLGSVGSLGVDRTRLYPAGVVWFGCTHLSSFSRPSGLA